MLFLASNFDAVLPLIYGIPSGLVALGLVSFWPAVRGHWSAPVLAAPVLLIGLLLTASVLMEPRKDMLIPSLWILYPAPLVVGVASIGIWLVSRLKRKS